MSRRILVAALRSHSLSVDFTSGMIAKRKRVGRVCDAQAELCGVNLGAAATTPRRGEKSGRRLQQRRRRTSQNARVRRVARRQIVRALCVVITECENEKRKVSFTVHRARST